MITMMSISIDNNVYFWAVHTNSRAIENALCITGPCKMDLSARPSNRAEAGRDGRSTRH